MLANYLYKNIRWNFNRKPFAYLLGPSTTKRQYFEQLERIADLHFTRSRRVEVAETEFCLNELALSRANNECEKVALGYFGEFWAQYVRLKKLFAKKFMLFPAEDKTRLERIAELICKCTQFALDDEQLDDLICETRERITLTEREDRYLKETVQLFKIKYYCAATSELLRNNKSAEIYLGRFLQPVLLKYAYSPNKKYSQAAYAGKNVASVIDCMGQSALRLGNEATRHETKIFVYANGRNVFDTFVESRFGERHAEFAGSTKTVKLEMSYFLTDRGEVRSCVLTNKGKRTRKFTVEIALNNTSSDKKTEYFKMGNALNIAADVFSSTAVLHNAAAIDCYGERSLTFDVTIESNSSYKFDIASVFADNTPTLAEQLADAERFGATRCPYLWDRACSRVNFNGVSLALTPNGHTVFRPQKIMSERINFSYQLGNADEATFVDNGGNSATLLNGFVFGIGGESVYCVQNGLVTKLNEQNFRFEGSQLVYEKKCATLTVQHENGKTYRIENNVAARTLFYFPLERRSSVTFDEKANAFEISDGLRKYTLYCLGKVESYTANALECSTDKIRYKLSDDLSAGNCLAICFGRAMQNGVILKNAVHTPASTPLVRESLISTYLNYVNDKNVFCLVNRLKQPSSLVVAAICYTNPQFVKEFLQKRFESNCPADFYYDPKGNAHRFYDKLTVPLATVYYLNLVGELPQEWTEKVRKTLFSEEFDGKDLCIKALTVLNAAKLSCFDKVQCLVEYNRLKKIICADSKLYPYAQAIGAVPLANPSKERLKDLCNKFEIPKSWYYVSQLENLYGLNLSAGKLQISPKITAENVLEQFALSIGGKRIDTTFAKASVQCMTLNGQQCFAPFYAPSLKREQNELIVRY